MTDPLTAATIDRLNLMIRRSIAFGDERDDIALALYALRVEPADPAIEHPLADLYRALVISTDERMVSLSREHQFYLTEAIRGLESGPLPAC